MIIALFTVQFTSSLLFRFSHYSFTIVDITSQILSLLFLWSVLLSVSLSSLSFSMKSYNGARHRDFSSTTVGQRQYTEGNNVLQYSDELREVVVVEPPDFDLSISKPENVQLELPNPFVGQRFYGTQPPRPVPFSDLQQTSAEIKSSKVLENITVDYSSLTPPSLEKGNMCQSLSDFDKYCLITGLPSSHKCNLLLAELKRVCPRSFLNFIRLGDNTYEGLKNFILNSFESVAKIHQVRFNPPWIENDAYSHFSKAVELYSKTPPEEFVKFIVLKTSPLSVQKAMEGHLNLPYDKFYEKFKSKLLKQYSVRAKSYEFRDGNNPEINLQKERRFEASKTVPDRIRQYDDRLCLYHRQYREKARKCNYGNCEMSHLVPLENKEFHNRTTRAKNEEARAQV